MKKLVSVLLALVLVCACSVAFARSESAVKSIESMADSWETEMKDSFPYPFTVSYISETDVLLITALMEGMEASTMRSIYTFANDENKANFDDVLSSLYEIACEGLKAAEAEDTTIMITICCDDNKIAIMTINGELANDFLKN